MSEANRPRGIYTKTQLRGVDLARTAEIAYEGASVWSVNDGTQTCLVNLDRRESTCAEYRKSRPRMECAHHWAVLYTIEPPTIEEFQTVGAVAPAVPTPASSQPFGPFISLDERDTKRAFAEVIRGGYTRHAQAYDETLRSEFMETLFFAKRLFYEIGRAIRWREPKERGRRQMPLPNLLLNNFMRAHNDWSYRRTEGFMQFLAHDRIHFIGPDYPDFNLASQFNRSPLATPLLRDVLALTAEPFREFGSLRLAADGTGIGSNMFADYRCEKRDGKAEARSARWFKAHVMCDVDSLHAVSVIVTPADTSEKYTMLKLLEDLTQRGYAGAVEEILADGGYHWAQIRDEIAELGAKPVVPWFTNSKNAISKRYIKRVRHPGIINAMFHAFSQQPQLFKDDYRMRVKVENLFSAVKGRFGGYVRSLDGSAPENEILWKFICHNVHVLLMAARVYKLEHELLRVGDDAA